LSNTISSYQQTDNNGTPNGFEQGLFYPYTNLSVGRPSDASTLPDIAPPGLISNVATPDLGVSSLNTPLPDISAHWSGNIQENELSEGMYLEVQRNPGEYPAIYDTTSSIWPEFKTSPNLPFYASEGIPKDNQILFSTPRYSSAAEYYSTDVDLARKQFFDSHPPCRHMCPSKNQESYEPCLCHCERCSEEMYPDPTLIYGSAGFEAQQIQQQTINFPSRQSSRDIAELDPWEPSKRHWKPSISYSRITKESILSKLANKANKWREKSREITTFSALRRLPEATLREPIPPVAEQKRVDIDTDVDNLATALKSSALS
jgi:hypothetical protein